MERIDLFETYEPIVQWTTFQLMFIHEVLMGLMSKQGKFIAAFIHADIPENEKVYVKIPRGFEQCSKNGRTKCLNLKKTLYGVRQSPHAFWQYLRKTLEKSIISWVITQSQDPD